MDIKLKINKLEESVNNLNNNELSLFLSGKDINYAIVNTLRRLVMSSVPIYAFHQDDMKFDINTSVFNNDMLKDRFRNIPIFNIDNDESTINSFDELESRKIRLVDKTNNLTMFINVKNNKDKVLINEYLAYRYTKKDNFFNFYSLKICI